MALKATLKTELLACFNYMKEHTELENGNEYLADKCSQAIFNYVSTGTLSTVDTGVHATGSYAGSGISSLSIDKQGLYSNMLSLFNYMWQHRNDDGFTESVKTYFATQMANHTKQSFTANKIQGTTIGVITTPTGGTTPYSGTIQGIFNGNETLNIMQMFITVFDEMWNRRNEEGFDGNEYLADKWSEGVDSYFKTLLQTLSIQDPTMTSSSCTGNFT